MRLHESGILDHLRAKYFPNLTYDYCGERTTAVSSPLTMRDIWPVFALLFTGLFLAILAFVFERCLVEPRLE